MRERQFSTEHTNSEPVQVARTATSMSPLRKTTVATSDSCRTSLTSYPLAGVIREAATDPLPWTAVKAPAVVVHRRDSGVGAVDVFVDELAEGFEPVSPEALSPWSSP